MPKAKAKPVSVAKIHAVVGSDDVEVKRTAAELAEKLKPAGEVAFNDFLLRFRVDGYDITIFRDARSIIRGTTDPAVARGLYARYIGA